MIESLEEYIKKESEVYNLGKDIEWYKRTTEGIRARIKKEENISNRKNLEEAIEKIYEVIEKNGIEKNRLEEEIKDYEEKEGKPHMTGGGYSRGK